MGLGQFTTPAANFCPAGYSLVPGASANIYPTSATAAQLAALQGVYCQNASGEVLADINGGPVGILYYIAAATVLLLAPGLWKLFAVPLAFNGYCSTHTQECILSL
jgi:hypothetical protein